MGDELYCAAAHAQIIHTNSFFNNEKRSAFMILLQRICH